MNDTGFHVHSEKQNRCASVYGVLDFCAKDATHKKFRKLWQTKKMEKLDVSSTYPMDKPGQFARGGIGLFSTIGNYIKFAQMLLNQGRWAGQQIIGRKTIELMHMNHLPQTLMPFNISNLSFWNGYGLGSRVLMDVAESQMPGSVGEFGWYGAAKTYFWVDPQEELIGILMAQYMLGPEKPEKEFQVLTYQALMD